MLRDVKNYDPEHINGHNYERFDVDNVHFEFQDFDIRDYGYNIATINGGVIRPNIFVRILYYSGRSKNVILKLETE